MGRITGLSWVEWTKDDSNPTENCPLATPMRTLVRTFTQVLGSHGGMPKSEI